MRGNRPSESQAPPRPSERREWDAFHIPGPGSSFLEALGAEGRTQLESIGIKRAFATGSTVFHTGQVADVVLVLLSGRVKVASVSDDGRERLLAYRGPGDSLGELSALDEQPRSATVTAIEPVEALVLSAGAFRTFLESSPRAAMFLLTQFASRMRQADRERLEYGASDTLGRVAARLVELAERYGEETRGGVRIDLKITQEELASWVGSSREGVNKALQTLKSLGWVEAQRRSITVLDLDALRQRAA